MALYNKDQIRVIKRKFDRLSKVMNEKNVERIAQIIVKDIKYWAWKGYEVSTGTKFAPLSKSYQRFRGGKFSFFTKDDKVIAIKHKDNTSFEPMINKIPKGKQFAQRKSNLTLTGKLIESIMYSIRGNIIRIGPSGRRSDTRLTNNQLGEIHQYGASVRLKNGTVAKIPPRPFLGMNPAIYNKIRDYVAKLITNALR